MKTSKKSFRDAYQVATDTNTFFNVKIFYPPKYRSTFCFFVVVVVVVVVVGALGIPDNC
jgi:hypothetical protein